jgi:hypothetical protein
MTHVPAPHHIETGWSPNEPELAMRAQCLDCGEAADAWAISLQYRDVQAARNQAKAWLAETCCRDKCPQSRANREESKT